MTAPWLVECASRGEYKPEGEPTPRFDAAPDQKRAFDQARAAKAAEFEVDQARQRAAVRARLRDAA